MLPYIQCKLSMFFLSNWCINSHTNTIRVFRFHEIVFTNDKSHQICAHNWCTIKGCYFPFFILGKFLFRFDRLENKIIRIHLRTNGLHPTNHIRNSTKILGCNQCDIKSRFKIWFIPTGKSLSTICRLKNNNHIVSEKWKRSSCFTSNCVLAPYRVSLPSGVVYLLR